MCFLSCFQNSHFVHHRELHVASSSGQKAGSWKFGSTTLGECEVDEAEAASISESGNHQPLGKIHGACSRC